MVIDSSISNCLELFSDLLHVSVAYPGCNPQRKKSRPRLVHSTVSLSIAQTVLSLAFSHRLLHPVHTTIVKLIRRL